MTDKVWLLREHSGSYYGKFFTSPFTAAAKGERLRRSMPNPGGVQYFVDMYALDLDDIPCDHISMEHF